MTVTAAPARADHDRLATAIATAAGGEPGLTARSVDEVLAALGAGRVVVATEGETVVGFVIAEPCGPVMEAASLWVRPGHRDARVFLDLIAVCESIVGDRWLVATFDGGFADYLERRRGYRRISIPRAIALSRGRFATQRLRRGRRSQVAQHLADARPIILLGTR